MKKMDLGQAITIFANAAVLAGMVLLAYELRQNTIATQLMASESHTAAAVAQAHLISSNPQLAELIARSIDGGDFTTAERLQLTNLWASRLRSWQNTYFQYERGAIDASVMTAYDNTVRDLMEQVPMMRRYWHDRTHRFSMPFVEHAQSVLSDIEEQ